MPWWVSGVGRFLARLLAFTAWGWGLIFLRFYGLGVDGVFIVFTGLALDDGRCVVLRVVCGVYRKRMVVTCFFGRISRAFGRCLLIPNCSSDRYVPTGISLGAPLMGFGGNRRPTVSVGVPVASTVVRSISNSHLTVTLTGRNNISFVCNSRSIRSRTTVMTHTGTCGTNFIMDTSGIAPSDALRSVLSLGRGGNFSAITMASSNATGNGLLNVIANHSCHPDHVSTSLGISRFVAPIRGLMANSRGAALGATGSVV